MHVNFSMLQLTIDSFFTLLLQYYPFGIMRFIDKFQKDCLWSFIKKPPSLQAQIVFIKININIDKISTCTYEST